MAEWAGRLSERVRFESRGELRGEAGDRGDAWVVRFERWAAVEPLARAERTAVAGDTRHAARRWRLMLREGVEPTLDMRMRWRGETLLPTGIERDPAAPGRIIIWAEDAAG